MPELFKTALSLTVLPALSLQIIPKKIRLLPPLNVICITLLASDSETGDLYRQKC
jgi:hypothetical protein